MFLASEPGIFEGQLNISSFAHSDAAYYISISLVVYIVAINIVAMVTLIYGITFERSHFSLKNLALKEDDGGKRGGMVKRKRGLPMANGLYHQRVKPRPSVGLQLPGLSHDARKRSISVRQLKQQYEESDNFLTDGTTSTYLLSLAVSDLLIGLVIAPLQISKFENQGRWLYGNFLCDLWRAMDILLCTSSAMHMAVIAVDRWWNIIQDVAPSTSLKLQKTLLVFLWMLSAMVSFPVMFLWQMEAPSTTKRENIMSCEPVSDDIYILLSTLISFFLPLSLTVAFYIQIVSQLHGHWTELRHRISQRFGTFISSQICQGDGTDGVVSGMLIPGTKVITQIARMMANSGIDESFRDIKGFHENEEIKHFAKTTAILKRSRRVIRTMTIVVFFYIICWLPLYTTLLLKATTHMFSFDEFDQLMWIFTWLGYCNSGINPLIYILSLKEYRKLFRSGVCELVDKISHLFKHLSQTSSSSPVSSSKSTATTTPKMVKSVVVAVSSSDEEEILGGVETKAGEKEGDDRVLYLITEDFEDNSNAHVCIRKIETSPCHTMHTNTKESNNCFSTDHHHCYYYDDFMRPINIFSTEAEI